MLFNHFLARYQQGEAEHNALMAALFARHPQWQNTLTLTRQGFTTATVAKLQGKADSSVRQMKARMRKAGITVAALH